MLTRILFATLALFIPVCAAAQQETGPAADVEAIHRLIGQYTKAVDTVDLNLLSQIWSHSPRSHLSIRWARSTAWMPSSTMFLRT